MNDKQALEMMLRCQEEINMLRSHIAAIEPKAHAYDAICTILDLLPRKSQGNAPDIVWILKNEINKLKAEESEVKA